MKRVLAAKKSSGAAKPKAVPRSGPPEEAVPGKDHKAARTGGSNNSTSTKSTTDKRSNRAPSPAPATALDPIQFSDQDRRPPKTYLTDKELQEFRNLLLAKRAELAGDVTLLAHGITNREGENGGQHSSMPIHMADLGSDNWEHEFTLGLIANERERIREIDEALTRIDDKSYGICCGTHRKISKARLRAKPWAKYCIDYARAREEGRAL